MRLAGPTTSQGDLDKLQIGQGLETTAAQDFRLHFLHQHLSPPASSGIDEGAGVTFVVVVARPVYLVVEPPD
jgi:hypothetical protein